MIFYLGTHRINWLWNRSFRSVRLFVSARQVIRRKRFPRACARYSVDSGGFQELDLFGRWTYSARDYCDLLLRLRDQCGPFEWAAPMDWMCEERVLRKTRLSLSEHQKRTVASYLELRRMEPGLPIIPVVQGFAAEDYLMCVDDYHAAGVNLSRLPLVGVGSVCRRQGEEEAADIIRTVAGCGIKVHGFGFKVKGFNLCADSLRSADSLAWSRGARSAPPLRGCHHGRAGNGSCANCPVYALAWYGRIKDQLTYLGQWENPTRLVV